MVRVGSSWIGGSTWTTSGNGSYPAGCGTGALSGNGYFGSTLRNCGTVAASTNDDTVLAWVLGTWRATTAS